MNFKYTYLKLWIVCLLILDLSPDVIAQSEKWTPEEIIHTQYVSSPVFSPDGSRLVWTQRKGLKEKDKFVSQLYMAYLDEQENNLPRTVQLTRSEESDNSPLFSRDGKYLYFLSSREEGKKLWRLNLYGGEPEEVHSFENGISDMAWQDDNTLLFIAGEGKTYYEIKNEKDNTQVIEDTAHWTPRRIYRFDVKNKEISRVTSNRYRISNFAVSRNGQHLVYREVTSPDYGVDANPKPRMVLRNLSSGEETQILESFQEPGNVQFTPDSRSFYFTTVKSSDPEWNGAGISLLHFYDLSTNAHKAVDLDWENGLEGYYILGNNLMVQLANGPYRKVRYYERDGDRWTAKPVELGDKQEHVELLAVSENGDRLVYTHSTASQLPEYFYARPDIRRKSLELVEERELVSLNGGLKKKPIARSEVIYWEGANGDQVNGILYYPKNYEAGNKYPLILSIHGGPTGVDRDSWSERWSTYPQIYTDKGAFVLKPNYHGSGSHSLEFIESIKGGNYYSLEQIDLYNGIQHLNEQGMIDMDKLGTMGWSNGAILTTMLTLKYPDMFKVAAPGAGDINWTSDYGTCQFGVSFDQSYFGGAPWDDSNGKTYNEWYIENSPLFEIEKIKTPTIIFHGSEDRAVPRDQGWEYYRGLQQVGQAPVKFLWFPGQPHGLQKITHQLRKMKEEIAWIDKYLFGKEEDENEAFKKESPLASLLQLDQAMTPAGLIGQGDNALLPPVTKIGSDSIGVGMFEVTKAQYAAYRGSESNDADGNTPVTGLTREEIENYLEWLSETTGDTYRLPTEKEAKALHKAGRKAMSAQNNMNYLAGYELTKPDARRLQEKISELNMSLIKPAGSHPMVKIADDKYVFDLGGNVAEYYMEGDEMKMYDYSAYDFVDPVSDNPASTSEHAGFRVIRE